MMQTASQSGVIASSARVWWAILVLGVGAFSVVTTELAPIGVLSGIAKDLNRTESAVGLTVSAYAWVGAASALASTIWLGNLSRKRLMVGLLVWLALSNLLAMTSNSFSMLLGSRLAGAVSHGLFWAMIGALAAQIAPAQHVGRATSIVFGGVSAASVLGVPLARMIGEAEGWRVAFGAIGALSLLTALAAGALVPEPPRASTTAESGLRVVLARRDLRAIYLVTTFAVIAHFAAFTFIEPYLQQIPDVPPAMIVVMLLSYGLAGLFGNVVTGILIDQHLKSVLLVALLLMCGALLVLGTYQTTLGATSMLITLVAWGAAIAVVFVSLQTWILRAAGAAALPASAVYVAIFNAAIGTGALVGSWLLTCMKLDGVMTCAGASSVIAILLISMLKAPRSATESAPEPLDTTLREAHHG